MTGVVLVNPRVKFTNSAGVPLALGWVTVYEAGTTTLTNTWQDKAQTTLNTNPIHLDANGECLLWGDSAKTYKLLLQDSALATVSGWPVDNIPGSADVGAAATAAAAAATAAASASATAAAVSAAAAAVSAQSAIGALSNRGIFATTAKGLSKGVASVTITAAGAGGTNGTFALAFTGGAGSGAAGVFVVSGGALVSITMTCPGDSYTSAPTVSFAASAGLAGATSLAVIANNTDSGEYFSIPSATTAGYLDLYVNTAGVAVYVSTYPNSTSVIDEILRSTASLGDVYTLSTAVAYGTTTPNTSTYPGGNLDTFFPTTPTATRGYLQDVSVRTAGGAGTGQIIVLAPDPTSTNSYLVKAIAAVNVVDGINTFQGSAVYTSVLAAGSRVGYRILTGGTPRYVGGGGVTQRISATAQTVGLTMAGALVDYANDVAVAYNMRPAATTSLDERVSDIEQGKNSRGAQLSALLGTAVSASDVTSGDTGLAVTGLLSTIGWVYSLAPVTAPCVLKTVTLPVASAVDGVFYGGRIAIGRPNAAGAIIVVSLTEIKVKLGTTNVISNFGELMLQRGDFVMVQLDGATSNLNYKAGTTDGGGYAVNHGTLALSATVALAIYTNTPIFSYTVRQTTSSFTPRLEKADLLAASSNPVALERTGFTGTSLPSGWVASGAWTVSNGLTPPGAGGWGVKVLNGTYSSISKRSQYWRIKINSTDTITGLAASPPENSGGAALLIDGVAGKLRLYSWDDTGAAGTLRSETALPAALTVGREYILKLDKDGFNLTGTFKDTVTQASCTVTLDGAATYTMALGKCGALFISATSVPVYQWMEYLAPYPRKCRALIIGDSIGEGAYLGSASPTWMAQIATARATQNDIVIAARAGDESPNFIGRRALDWDIWMPQFAVIAIGTNDLAQDTWRINVAALISKAVSLGAEPILCTQVPRTAAQALRTAMNTDIRTGYFGRYRYIDMAIPVSSGNLGLAWSATYDSGDGVHPNAAGQNLMYAQAQIEAPYLFV